MKRCRVPERLEDWPKWLRSAWLQLYESLGVKMNEGNHEGVYADLREFMTTTMCQGLARIDRMLQLQDGPQVLRKIRKYAIRPIHAILMAMAYCKYDERRREFDLLRMAQQHVSDYLVGLDDFLQALLDLAGTEVHPSPDAPAQADAGPQPLQDAGTLLSDKLRILRQVRTSLFSYLKKLAHELPSKLSQLCRQELRSCLMAALTDLTAAGVTHRMTLEQAKREIKKVDAYLHQLKGLRGRELARGAKHHLKKLRIARATVEDIYVQFMPDLGGLAKGTLKALDGWTALAETGGMLYVHSCWAHAFIQTTADAKARKDAAAAREAEELARSIVLGAEHLHPRGYARAAKELGDFVKRLRRHYKW